MRRAVHIALIGGYVNPRQQGIEQRHGQRRQQDGQHRRQDDLRGQRPPHARLIMRARVARGDDAEARADAEGKLQEDENQRLCIVDARHIGGGQRLAYDRRVADRV